MSGIDDFDDLDAFLASVPHSWIEAYRDEIYTPRYIQANPHKFLNTKWVDIKDFKMFTARYDKTQKSRKVAQAVFAFEVSSSRNDAVSTSKVKAEPQDDFQSLFDNQPHPESPELRPIIENGREIFTLFSSDDELELYDRVEIPDSDACVSSECETAVASSDWGGSASMYDDSESDSDADFETAVLEALSNDNVRDSHAVDALNAEQGRREEPSDTIWFEEDLRPTLRRWKHQLTRETDVQSLEVIHGLPSYFPIPRESRGYLVDGSDWDNGCFIGKNGEVLTMDYLIKNMDQDSWKGTTGESDNKPIVHIDGVPVQCRRSRLKCNGFFACEHADPELIKTQRYELDPDSLQRVINASIESRVTEADTREKRALIFYAVCHAHQCAATASDGSRCKGIPILRAFKDSNSSRNGKHYFVACSGWREEFRDNHHQSSIPPDVDEELLKVLFAGKPLPGFEVPRTCGSMISPYIGRRLKNCKYPHRGDGTLAKMKHQACPAERWILVPLDKSIRKAIVYHGSQRGISQPHNHPILPARKVPKSIRETYAACVRAFGIVGATVSRIDAANSTQEILGVEVPGIAHTALQNRRVREDEVRKEKRKKFPHGLEITGAYHLYREDQILSPTDRYIHHYHDSGGRLLIVTADAYLLALVHQALCLQVDTTFKRTNGEYNEWEVVIWLREVQRAITIARIYTNAADRAHYRAIFAALDKTIEDITKQPLRLKRLSKSGTLIAICVDLELAQALGAGDYFLSTNDPTYSHIHETTAEGIIPYFIRACSNHVNRGMKDLKSHVSDHDYWRITEFPYLDSAEKVESFSTWILGLHKKKVTDWWNHKRVNKWILPTIVKALSKIHPDDWDAVPTTTNINESQHAHTNTHTGTKLTLVESIIQARTLDKGIALEVRQSFLKGGMKNHRNDTYTRMSRNTTRATNASNKAREANATNSALAGVRAKIKELEVVRRQLMDKGKAESSSSGRVKESGGRPAKRMRLDMKTTSGDEVTCGAVASCSSDSPENVLNTVQIHAEDGSEVGGSTGGDYGMGPQHPDPIAYDVDGAMLLSVYEPTLELPFQLADGQKAHTSAHGFLDALNNDHISPYDIDFNYE